MTLPLHGSQLLICRVRTPAYIAGGHHIWWSFPYPPPGDAVCSLQLGLNNVCWQWAKILLIGINAFSDTDGSLHNTCWLNASTKWHYFTYTIHSIALTLKLLTRSSGSNTSPSGAIWSCSDSTCQPGLASVNRCWSSVRGFMSPHDKQTTRCVLPWSSIQCELPALRCNSSTFWVTR